MTSSPQVSPYWRVRWAAFGAVAALALVGLGLLLTSMVQSPQEALASAQPPPPSRITVPVEVRTLDLSVSARGSLVSPRHVTGDLPVEVRERASKATWVRVVRGRQVALASLRRIALDGAFTVTLKAPIRGPHRAPVRVMFRSAAPARSGLVVPISALFTSSGAGVAVVVVRNGHDAQVPVKTRAQVDGFVRIEPVHAGALIAGDEVLVSEPAS